MPNEPGRIAYDIQFEYRGHRCTGVMHMAVGRARDDGSFAEIAEIAATALKDVARTDDRDAYFGQRSAVGF